MFTRTGKLYLSLGIFLVLLVALAVFLYFGAAAPGGSEETVRFVVVMERGRGEAIEKLKDEELIRSSFAFGILHQGSIEAGAYRLSPMMSAFEVSRVLGEGPYMKWIGIPEGVRKEQIAEILARELSWSDEKVRLFILEDTQKVSLLSEGVFFPETYLIAKDESGEDVARRLYNSFNEVFAPYLEEALEQNIRWSTLVKIASLVQREAAGKEDMALVAGILWNRLLEGQRLELDASVQYVRDTLQNYTFDESGAILSYTGRYAKENGWWSPISVEDKKSDIFNANTYRNAGLPDVPIANPGEEALKAVLFPEETDCFFYLHDNKGVIHCAETFDEHKKNIERYLRS